MSELSSCLANAANDAVLLQPRGRSFDPDYPSAYVLLRKIPGSTHWMFNTLLYMNGTSYTGSPSIGTPDEVSRMTEYHLGPSINDCDIVGVSYDKNHTPENLKSLH